MFVWRCGKELEVKPNKGAYETSGRQKASAGNPPWLQVADDEDKDLEHGKVCDDMWALDLNKFSVRDCGGGRALPGPRTLHAPLLRIPQAAVMGLLSIPATHNGRATPLLTDCANSILRCLMRSGSG